MESLVFVFIHNEDLVRIRLNLLRVLNLWLFIFEPCVDLVISLNLIAKKNILTIKLLVLFFEELLMADVLIVKIQSLISIKSIILPLKLNFIKHPLRNDLLFMFCINYLDRLVPPSGSFSSVNRMLLLFLGCESFLEKLQLVNELVRFERINLLIWILQHVFQSGNVRIRIKLKDFIYGVLYQKPLHFSDIEVMPWIFTFLSLALTEVFCFRKRHCRISILRLLLSFGFLHIKYDKFKF